MLLTVLFTALLANSVRESVKITIPKAKSHKSHPVLSTYAIVLFLMHFDRTGKNSGFESTECVESDHRAGTGCKAADPAAAIAGGREGGVTVSGIS